MSLFSLTHGASQRCTGVQQNIHRLGSKEGHVHRREEDLVAFILQIPQTNFHRVKHLGSFVLLVSQENNTVSA